MRIWRLARISWRRAWVHAVTLALLVAPIISVAPAAASNLNSQREALTNDAAQLTSQGTVGNDADAVQDDDGSDSGVGFNLAAMGKALFAAFIMAVVLESALALIFNWRPFVRTFDGRGVKSVIALAASLAFVRYTDLDLLSIFEKAMDGSTEPQRVDEAWFGSVLTAMVVAGGSAGVNRLLVALGFRSVLRAEEVVPKPPKDRAWISARLERSSPNESGTVRVMLKEGSGDFRLIGQISGSARPPGFLRWALQDRTRFPTLAGYSLVGDRTYELELRSDEKSAVTTVARWGPVMVASGAIVDLQFNV